MSHHRSEVDREATENDTAYRWLDPLNSACNKNRASSRDVNAFGLNLDRRDACVTEAMPVNGYCITDIDPIVRSNENLLTEHHGDRMRRIDRFNGANKQKRRILLANLRTC